MAGRLATLDSNSHTGSPLLYAVESSEYQPDEPIWRDYRCYKGTQSRMEIALPACAREWLLDPGSLTQRLIKASQGHFEVQVLSQCWGRPQVCETALLEMRSREAAIIRQVALLCRGQPWVFARSVIPASSVSGRLRRLRIFDNSSLGEMLFTDKTMRRHPFELAVFAGDSPYIPSQLHQQQAMWGRRCRFELTGKPLMVSEIFLRHFRP